MKKSLVLFFVLLYSLAIAFADAQPNTNAGAISNGPSGLSAQQSSAANTNTPPDQSSGAISWTPATTFVAWVLGAFIFLVLLGGLVIGIILFAHWTRRLNSNSPQSQPMTDGQFRGALARSVTVGALLFIGSVSTITLVAAGLYSLVSKHGTEDSKLFFDIVKYVIATLLPVVAAWVSTVLAFYFGKENFEAATKSVKDMATAMTSKDKLAATPVKLLGMARKEFLNSSYSLKTADLAQIGTVDLKTIKDAFANYERLPVLFPNDAPYFVLHKSTLNDFLLKKTPVTADKLTIADFLKSGKDGGAWLPENSFVTVGPDATAGQAKDAMEKNTGCADVLVTVDGTPNTPTLRWITNVDLLQASQV